MAKRRRRKTPRKTARQLGLPLERPTPVRRRSEAERAKWLARRQRRQQSTRQVWEQRYQPRRDLISPRQRRKRADLTAPLLREVRHRRRLIRKLTVSRFGKAERFPNRKLDDRVYESRLYRHLRRQVAERLCRKRTEQRRMVFVSGVGLSTAARRPRRPRGPILGLYCR